MVMPSMATLMAKKARAYHEITDRMRVWTIWNTRTEKVIRNTPIRNAGFPATAWEESVAREVMWPIVGSFRDVPTKRLGESTCANFRLEKSTAKWFRTNQTGPWKAKSLAGNN